LLLVIQLFKLLHSLVCRWSRTMFSVRIQ
jgi:hypothetical protein